MGFLYLHFLKGDLGADAMGIERSFDIREFRSHEISFDAGIHFDERGKKIPFFHQLSLKNMDFIHDPVGESGCLDRERVWLDPAGCLEKEGAGGRCGLLRGGFRLGFFLYPYRRKYLHGLGWKQSVAEKKGEQEGEASEDSKRKQPDAKTRFCGCRGFRGFE